MAMYYEVGITIGGAKSITTVDNNFIKAKAWKDAVDYVMNVSRQTYPSYDVEVDFVKEYNIAAEPKDIGYIHAAASSCEI